MARLIAIGDIHGMLHKLIGLMEQIAPEKEDTFVFLGDYIDRGYESYDVVEYLISLKREHPNVITLLGNHEEFVLSFFNGNQNPKDRQIWLDTNGGHQTVKSYRKAGFYMDVHRDFYESLLPFWQTNEYFFCHAGVRPGIPLERQRLRDMCWIREPFLSSSLNFGKIVVHGHTIADKPEILGNRINIDSGAGIHGPLTAIELPSLKIWQQM